jgi:hypothetical protein
VKARRRILLVVAGSLAEFGGLVALLAEPLGAVRGFLVALAAVAAANTIYLVFVRPWQVHWGATGEEAARPMPGDDITGPGVRCTTRAVTIDAPASQVWCLDLEPLDQYSCRLISRWRAKWFTVPASARWVGLCDPGSFITEHRMLLKIKERAEQGASGLALH